MNVFRSSIFFLLTVICVMHASAQTTFPVNGVQDQRHTTYAFINANIYADYKTRSDSSVLIIRDGKVEAVGKKIPVPADAVVTDLKGKYIYPAFIDLYSEYGMPEIKKQNNDGYPQFLSNTRGAYNWNQAIKPEQNAFAMFGADEKKADELRRLGFGAVLTHQKDGIMRGTGALVLLGDEKENKSVLLDKASAQYSFDKGSSSQDYPSSLMGAIALIRQTYYDARWYATSNPKPEYNISLDAFNKIQNLPQIFEVSDKYSVLRADKIAKEFSVPYIIKGSGDEYQRILEIKETNAALIIPLSFPQAFDVEDPYDALQISLAEMKHWELAPYNASAVANAGIKFAITSADLKDKKDFLRNLKRAVDCGLPETEALKALTLTPAELLHVSDQVGTLSKGMLANFIISSKKLFDKDNLILENWCRGKQYRISDPEQKDIRGTYELLIGKQKLMKLRVEGELNELKAIIEEDTTKIKAGFIRNGNQITISKGAIRLTGTVGETPGFSGRGQDADGEWINWSAKFISVFIPEIKKDSLKKEKINPGPLAFPNKAFGNKSVPEPASFIIRNATVWTNEKDGILKRTDIWVSDGKIKKIGKNISSAVDSKIQIIDGTGHHLTPGIIDEHSHICISRGVNEGTQAVTSEVRIGDVVNPDDINMYRALAGGVTSAHLLHGSANPIGGQTQLIKLRWGASPEKLKFENWPGFIKFALGENVKQSNWGDKQTSRFPQTRMGVEQVYVDAFTRAKEYAHSATTDPKNFRRNLELDALVEIMNSKRFITCHSYQQGEINMLMHVADSMGFRVNTFTHILEGYKVADKMKKHGAGASTFSDWWAYKYEVVEAIPHNGAILHDMGIVTAFNSDDPEMGRRLNQEAAKAVKYGNVSEEEALKMVTLNPAILLHVDQRVGSIREGKDADLVLWDANPLSVYAKPLITMIDGAVYFDLEKDKNLREENQKEKARLVKRMMDAKRNGDKTQKASLNPDEEIYKCETILEHY